MNPLLKFVIRKMDDKCQAWEEESETDHQVPDEVEEFLDQTFQGAGGVPLGVDIFRTKDRGLRPLPVIVMIHGGGLVVGSRKLSRTFCEKLAALGFLVFAPEYRRATQTNAISEIGDVFAAFSFISDQIAGCGGDPGRVTVVSESAGSFLAVYAVAAIRSPVLREVFGLPDPTLRVNALACISGMFYSARKDLVGLVYAGNIYGEKKKDPSFMQYMDPECPEVIDHLPRMFLVGSDADFLKRYTKRYAAALRNAHHPCKLLYYEENKELTHSFPALKPDLPESREVLDKLKAWIENSRDR